MDEEGVSGEFMKRSSELTVLSSVPADGGRKKKGRAGLIVLIIILVLLLAGGALAFIFLNRPMNKINKALEAGDITAVVELYGDLSDNRDKKEVSKKLLVYAEEVRDDYFKERLDYETALEKLAPLSGAPLKTDDEIEEILIFISDIHASREAFLSAEDYRAGGSYVSALEEYAKVISEDTRYYDKAQAAIEEIKQEWIRAAVEEAYGHMNNGNYSQAVNVLQDVMNVIPEGSSELTDALSTVQEAMQNAIAALQSQKTLIGTWAFEYDILPLIVGELGDEFSDFDSPLMLPIIFELNENGIIRMYPGDDFKDNMDAWMDDIATYYVGYLLQAWGLAGMSRDTIESYFKFLFGVSPEEYVRSQIEGEMGSVEDLFKEVKEMEMTGLYEVQGDRLYISGEYENTEYDYYVIFEVFDDILMLSDEEGGLTEELPGLPRKLTLTRVAETY